MIQGNKLNSTNTENGLNVCIDYLGFTITAPWSVDDVIDFMGFDSALFEELPKGADGYKHMRKCPLNGIAVLYDGNEDMGIHVNVTGQGIAPLLEAFQENYASETPFGKGYDLWNETVLSRFFKEVLEVGHFSRIDTAIDDFGANYYTPEELLDLYDDDRVVSKWKGANYAGGRKSPRISSGYTVYFGSRSSSLMLRVYDKKREQNKGKKPSDNDYIDVEWTRWELEFKKERADDLAKQLITCDEQGLGSLVIGILYYYFRIIELDDCNRSRCSNAEKWNDFVHNVEKLRLCVPKHEKTIFEKEAWIDRQVSPSLALLFLYNDGDLDYLNNFAVKAISRISPSDRERLRLERPDIYEQIWSSENYERECYDCSGSI